MILRFSFISARLLPVLFSKINIKKVVFFSFDMVFSILKKKVLKIIHE